MLGDLRIELRRRLRRRQRRERVRRDRHHAEARRRAVQGRRRRDHARQPHLPASRGLAVPRGAPRDHPARRTSSPTQPGRGTAIVERDGVTLGVVNLAGNLYMNQAAPALLAADEALKEVARADHVLVDMHAEATSEKVALGWYLDGKRDRRRRHAHPRPDRRRARAAGRDRLHHRRRHDRRARRRDRRPARAVDRGHAHAHAAALRPGRGGPVDQRRADPLRTGTAARRRSSRCCVRCR